MKKIRVIQNSVGHYNFLDPKEESFTFSMVIQEDGKTITDGKLTAKLHFSGDIDKQYDFEDTENIGYIFGLCYENSNRWFGSTDYAADCLFFAKVYSENFEELSASAKTADLEMAQKELKELEERKISLEDRIEAGGYGLDNYSSDFAEPIRKRMAMYQKWVDDNNAKISQFKDGAPDAQKIIDDNAKYQSKIDQLQAILTHIQEMKGEL